MSSGSGSWYLVNATPDVTEQIDECNELRPPRGSRRTPVAGVVLTDAELDHTLGLLRLREAADLELVAVDAVRDALCSGMRLDAVLAPYLRLQWRAMPIGVPVSLGGDGLEVTAIPVSQKRPRYAAGLADETDRSWVVALHIRERGGAALVYAPAVARWSPELAAAMQTAECVFLDGTFWDDDEPRTAGVSQRTACGMGHLPISGPEGTAERMAQLPASRRFYTHLNNTNPLNDPRAAQHAVLADLGVEVATENAVITL